MSVKVYGADWCHMTQDTLSCLKRLGVQYEYINIERDKTAAIWVKAQSNGKEKKPTLDIDGTVLVEPDDDELEETLRAMKVIESPEV
jgi:glutaredoxin